MVILEATRALSLFKVKLCSQMSRLWPSLSPAFMLTLCCASHSSICLSSASSSPLVHFAVDFLAAFTAAELLVRHQQSGCQQESFHKAASRQIPLTRKRPGSSTLQLHIKHRLRIQKESWLQLPEGDSLLKSYFSAWKGSRTPSFMMEESSIFLKLQFLCHWTMKLNTPQRYLHFSGMPFQIHTMTALL